MYLSFSDYKFQNFYFVLRSVPLSSFMLFGWPTVPGARIFINYIVLQYVPY